MFDCSPPKTEVNSASSCCTVAVLDKFIETNPDDVIDVNSYLEKTFRNYANERLATSGARDGGSNVGGGGKVGGSGGEGGGDRQCWRRRLRIPHYRVYESMPSSGEA